MNYRDTLEEIELRTDLNNEFDSITKFMIGICRSLQLSPIGREALEVVTRYLDGVVSDQELKRIRVACWNSIKGRDSDLTDPEVAATRAILCATYPRGWPDDEFFRLDIFESFAIAAGIAPHDLGVALKTAFAVALNQGTAQPGAPPRSRPDRFRRGCGAKTCQVYTLTRGARVAMMASPKFEKLTEVKGGA